MLQLPVLQHAHPDDRAGAVLRAPGHSLQRVPPYPRPARAWAHGRSRHVPVRPRRHAAGPARVPLRAAAADDRDRDRPVVEKAAARFRAARSPRAAALASEKYDAVHSHEEGSWFGVVLAGLLGLPHLYDMHSSLPQQLTNFAYSQSRLVKAPFSVAGALRHPPLARRDRDLSAARGGRPRHRHGRAVGADRERAGIGRHADGWIRAGGPARARDRRRRAGRAVHGNVRGVPGARPAVRVDAAASSPRGPTRGWCWPAGGPTRSRRRGARRPRPASGRRRSSPGSGPPKRFRRSSTRRTSSSRRAASGPTRR